MCVIHPAVGETLPHNIEVWYVCERMYDPRGPYVFTKLWRHDHTTFCKTVRYPRGFISYSVTHT